MKNLTTILICAVVLMSTGCQKYDGGGFAARAEANLTSNSWTLQTYFRNGVDETNLLIISSWTESYSDEGTFVYTYVDSDSSSIVEEGEWVLSENSDQVQISGVSSLNLTEGQSSITPTGYNIIRLKKGEFWYEYENSGDLHEFRFVPN